LYRWTSNPHLLTFIFFNTFFFFHHQISTMGRWFERKYTTDLDPDVESSEEVEQHPLPAYLQSPSVDSWSKEDVFSEDVDDDNDDDSNDNDDDDVGNDVPACMGLPTGRITLAMGWAGPNFLEGLMRCRTAY
jgi:hypothetical protein